MEDMSHVTLADPEDLPKGISKDARETMVSIINQHKKDVGEIEKTSGKVTVELCETFSQMKENGVPVSEIQELTHIDSPNTIYYHLRGDCSHQHRAQVTYSECGWMRIKAQQGAGTPELSEEYDLSQENTAVHVTGKCQHEDGIEPVSGDQLYKNSRSSDRWTTSVCPVCGEQFRHKDYRERTTCSDDCNVEYASEMSRKQRAAGD